MTETSQIKQEIIESVIQGNLKSKLEKFRIDHPIHSDQDYETAIAMVELFMQYPFFHNELSDEYMTFFIRAITIGYVNKKRVSVIFQKGQNKRIVRIARAKAQMCDVLQYFNGIAGTFVQIQRAKFVNWRFVTCVMRSDIYVKGEGIHPYSKRYYDRFRDLPIVCREDNNQ